MDKGKIIKGDVNEAGESRILSAIEGTTLIQHLLLSKQYLSDLVLGTGNKVVARAP